MVSTDRPADVGGALSLATLLRGARARVAGLVRDALSDGGFGDLPANGPFVLGALARSGLTVTDVGHHLGVTKQTTAQLADLLATRRYVSRTVDPDDRRRLMLQLTERGRDAADVIHATIDGVEQDLRRSLGDTRVDHTRQVLEAMRCWVGNDG